MLRRPWCYLDSAGNAVEDRSSAQHAVTHGYLGEMGEKQHLRYFADLAPVFSFEASSFPEFSGTAPRCRFLPCSPLC